MIITGGKYKGRLIEAPEESITRPTLSKVRMSVFNTLYSIIGDFEGKTFLDLFGGSGIMGLEALSRGFEKVKVFERNPKVAQVIIKNYQTLGLKPDLAIGDSLRLISKVDEIFDAVYIDPPYQSDMYNKILPIVKGRIIIAEHSKELDLKGFITLKQKKYGNKYISYMCR